MQDVDDDFDYQGYQAKDYFLDMLGFTSMDEFLNLE